MTEASSDDSLRDRVLSSITEQGITPKPGWHFLLHESVVWSIALAALVAGSIASALSIYIASASRFMIHTIHASSLEGLFEIVPVVWLLLFGCAIWYSIHAMRDTRRGYRFSIAWLVVFAIMVSNGIGYLLYVQGFGAALDRYLLSEVTMYSPMSGFRPGHWMHVQEGVIVGVVLEMQPDSFKMRSLDGEVWHVVRSTTTVASCPFGDREIREGVPVRLQGTTTGSGVYEAYEVCEFRGRGSPSRSGTRPSVMHTW